jgi:hypothetical protein
MKCPYCGKYDSFDAQTKDLGRNMFRYRAYDKDQLLDRTTLPVFKAFPLDRSDKDWKSQDELMRAEATIPLEYSDCKYITVIASCNSVDCQFYSDREDILLQGCPSGFGRSFDGRIKIENGMLVGKIYDIEKLHVKSEEELNKYKEVDPEKYARLMEKYKHEPLACRHWGFK